MGSVACLSGPIHLGMDVAMDSIAVGILPWGQDRPVVDRIAHDEVSVRRLVARLGNPGRLRACYEQPMRMFVKRVCPGGWACGAGLAAVRCRAGVCWQGLAREGGVPVPWSSGST
jgi:hypothetical protein